MSAPNQDLATLLRQVHLNSHEDLLKAANNVLKKSKSDLNAQHARIVALLKLERYEEVLRAYNETGDKLKEHAPLEYAYALYRHGSLNEAEAVATKAGAKNRGLQHVAAQTSYRLEKFNQSSRIYNELLQDSEAANEEFDLRINRSAVDAQLEFAGQGDLASSRKTKREDLDAFESAFNAASACVARGELSQADVLLSRARQLCSASPDLSDEEKVNELSTISIQQLYILTALGREEEAVKLCKSINLEGITDLSLRHIANINYLVAVPQSNPFLAHRIFHSTPEAPQKDKPFQFQSTTLLQDRYALDLQSQKFLGVAKSTASQVLSASHPTTSPVINSLSVINAAAKAHNGEGTLAIKSIKPLLEKRPTDLGLLLLLIQLFIIKNNHTSAISLLESFMANLKGSEHNAIKYAPGLVSTAVSLYTTLGRKAQARTLLSSAAEYWIAQTSETSAPPNASLLRAAGSALLESTDAADLEMAAAIFAKLHARDPDDKAAAAGLVAATCMTDPTALDRSLLAHLTPAARLVGTIDAAALEDAGVARPGDALLSSDSKSKKRTAPTDAKSAAPRKKKKKLAASRMPKDFVPGKTVDLERWLPMRDRSYWRPKGRKGKARAAGLMQGGVVDEAKEGKEVLVGVQQAGGGGVAQAAKKKKMKGKGKK